MTRLLQLSDIHFGTEDDDVVEALVAHVGALRPDALVVSGDLTQRATATQFAAARRFLDRLKVPVLLTQPGNHDMPLFAVWTRLLAPYRRYRRLFDDESAFEHDTGSLLLLGINSARNLRHKNGVLSDRQIARIAARLDAASPAQARIVSLHHPVHAIRERNERDLVRNGERAVRAWVAAGADLIIGGHLHLPYLAPLSDRYPDLPRRCWCLQAGTATSSRLRHGVANSMNLIDVAGGELHIERHDHDARSGTFERVSPDVLVLQRARTPR